MSRSNSGSTWTRRDDEDGGEPPEIGGDTPSREALRLAELGLLTAGLLHELRQPVFALKALAQLAESHPQRAGDYLGQLLAQVRTIESLIEGYADFSRRPAGRREVFELGAPVRSAMVVLEHRAEAARVVIEVDVADLAVRGSLLAVQQAVVNLGQNAIDALRGQADGRLRIVGELGPSGGVLRIEDNGPGLPDFIRDHLYQPFHTTKPTGTGLGLSISRDLLVAGGAELRLLDVDTGTTWEISVPVAD